MPRKQARLSPRAMAPIPKMNLGLINPRWPTYYRMIEERFDRSDTKLDKLMEKTRDKLAFRRTAAWSSAAASRHGRQT